MYAYTRLAILSLCAAVALHAAPAQADLTIGNYTLVSSQRVSRTDFEYTYRVDVTNTGAAVQGVTATVTSSAASTSIVDRDLSFGDVAGGATVTSSDTFTIRQSRLYVFDTAALAWDIHFDQPASSIGSVKEVTPGEIEVDPKSGQKFVRGQLLITAAASATPENIRTLVESLGGLIVGHLKIVEIYQVEFSGVSLETLRFLRDQLDASDLTTSVILNKVVEQLVDPNPSATPNDGHGSWNQWDLYPFEDNVLFDRVPSGDNWGMEAIRTPEAWRIAYGEDGSNISESPRIGVIDTDFPWRSNQSLHEDLIIQWFNTAGSEVEGFQHGHHVAGIIGATANNGRGVSGVVWDAKIYGYSYRVATSSVLHGILTLIVEQNVGIINLSLGAEPRKDGKDYVRDFLWDPTLEWNYHGREFAPRTGGFAIFSRSGRPCWPGVLLGEGPLGENISDQLYEQNDRVVQTNADHWNSDIEDDTGWYVTFITRLLDNGYDFLLVESAGNGRIDSRLTFGFCLLGSGGDVEEIRAKKHVINVGNADVAFDDRLFQNDYPRPERACSSSFGRTVDLFAPGEGITSTVYNYPSGSDYERMSGTSMAAPHVTGVAALIKQIYPAMTWEEVRDVLVQDGQAPSETAFNLEVADRIAVSDGNGGWEEAEGQVRRYPFLDATAALNRAATIAAGGVVQPPLPMGFLAGAIRLLSSQTCGAEPDSSFDEYDFLVSAQAIDRASGSVNSLVTSELGLVENGTLFFGLDVRPGDYQVLIDPRAHGGATEYAPIALQAHIDAGVTHFAPEVRLLPLDTEVGDVDISIQATSALTGNLIGSGAMFTLRSGFDPTAPLMIEQTTEQGVWGVTVQPGNYNATIEAPGYEAANGKFSVLPCEDQQRVFQIPLSPQLQAGEYRVVLTWGASPRDLDSHLTGPSTTGTGRFHVYYANPQPGDGGGANLDRDDVTSYGPETITVPAESVSIPNFQDGLFRYSVHDYTNRFSSTSDALSKSGATVALYGPGGLVAEWHVPPSPGTLWTVFEMENFEVTEIGGMSFMSSPSEVQ